MKNYKENKIRKEKDLQDKLLTDAQRWQKELEELEKSKSRNHPDVARFFNKFAVFYHGQGQESYAAAERLQKQAIIIYEKSLGPDHPDLAQSLTNLAGTYFNEGQYMEAVPLLKRAILIYEKSRGPNDLYLAGHLEQLARVYRKTNREADAVKLEQHVASIRAIKQSK